MEFKIDKLDNYTQIQVMIDKLDTHIAPSLKSELVLIAGNGEKNIILDLSNCRYCDSSGLSAILVANRLCKNANGTFVLSGLQTAVERLITISQLDTVLNITNSVKEAADVITKEGA
ncbi:MAG TPA: anti-anti-sigma factor [Marinilabiliales bacterium]|jgi:anti-anti-sigma factor|nr:MAG: anti-anti-sigma factor [Bacteroidetes bacterium GWA2_40_14]OFX62730.1 MAG: anti-anti-sigma factor [Bacteroidetes bacterium GWC2_40_13]OFX72001.1 MAG: anti-anti-sigma factor [Bacteroidetes bacterium GWD2_40_43]OFX89606.1 MAG: anti-anti-sigma factor [Bacteroidetes bacterium GWE2_40_63]OFY24125.1 MAG: anti-anti-sigma factor [Bacteroidetes bacterium GWF2_40_13]OFZ26317.1 MAG: anti-anti-sigma factor [Bacteroidetes bacterium RIFOXYC2_FULL_40_12]HAM99538.1 anti-anti-sigma factor [Marinilabil